MPQHEPHPAALPTSTADLLRAHDRLLDLSRDAILVRELDGTITFWNAGAERLYGWPREEALGRVSHELLATVSPVPLAEILATLERTGEWEGELVQTTRAGEQITVLSRWVLDRDEAGQPRFALETNTDITTRRSGESARAYLAAIVESSEDAILGVGLDGTIRTWNAGAVRLFGYAPEEAIGQPIDLIVPPAYAGEPRRNLALIAEGKRVVPYETVRLRRDGRGIDISLSLSPVRNVAGQLLGAAAIARDIGARKEAERERERLLRQAMEAEERFRSLLEAAPDGIVVTDADGLIALVNRRAETLFGYDRGELIGQPLEALLPACFDLRPTGRYPGTAWQEEPGLELLARRRDSGEFPVEISLSPLAVGDQELITAIVRDVTERAAAERRLREAMADLARSNDELERFAYVASHDLQEPLRMVASYTQLLARRYRGRLDADADEFIGYAVDGATRMQQLIRDLLEYSRVGTRGRPFEPVETATVVERVLLDLRAATEESGARVTTSPLPRVQGDPTQVRQLLQNLIGNALKYRRTDAPPEVRIDATSDDDRWRFVVRDNGIGIAPEFHERVFGLFQRLHTQEEYEGTGIGLAICKKIVERHGGRIWLESAPGAGTAISFTLPASDD